VKNHGMASLFLDELLKVSRQFFALPLEEKLKCSIAEDFFNGYGNAAVIAGDHTLNWNDRLFLTVYPEEQRRLQVWPQTPLKFREVLHEFSLSLRKMLEVILKAMARSLGLKEDSFVKEHGEQGSIDTRFGIYPRCSRPDKVYGVHPHSDRSSITVLLSDINVPEGLHIQKDDQWFKVPVIPGALFVNLGDFAEVMSNGIFKSVAHRVVTNSERERFSVAAFCTPEPENEVGPINELISSNQPQLYKKFFALPLEEKLNYSAMEEDVYSGYGNSAVLAGAEDKPINWNYRLFRTVYPEDQRKIQFWPQKPQKFR
uniref:Fe2OG dioxygenase domain-containing protein n=1 Tax=Chenopodium quinoa TaxID=63459 RepID=A0A803L640_CHEQI